jgi:hypothetical protein
MVSLLSLPGNLLECVFEHHYPGRGLHKAAALTEAEEATHQSTKNRHAGQGRAGRKKRNDWQDVIAAESVSNSTQVIVVVRAAEDDGVFTVAEGLKWYVLN